MERTGIAAAALALFAFDAQYALAAQRTYVAVSGIDNAQCSASAPCRSFAAALTATDAQGEIIVLESGGYGRVTSTSL